MLDYSESPPSLHHSPSASDKGLFPSRDSTPVTPVGFSPSIARRPEKDKDLYIPWFRKPIDIRTTTTTSLYLDSTLLDPDFDDHSFPLFGSSPPQSSMAGAASPINIASRHASTSPRGQQPSNLTTALHQTSSSEKRAASAINPDGANNGDSGRSISMGDGLPLSENGAKPISMKSATGDKLRRESLAQSLTGGMSWGGVSVGSWIRDEYVLAHLVSDFVFARSALPLLLLMQLVWLAS